MSVSANLVVLMGYVGRAETTTRGGKDKTTISVATHSFSRGAEKTDWHSVTFWDDEEAQSVYKGDLVVIEGKLSYYNVTAFKEDGSEIRVKRPSINGREITVLPKI